MSNLHQIGVAIHVYAAENEGVVPESGGRDYPAYDTNCGQWMHLNTPGYMDRWIGLGRLYRSGYLRDPKVFYCPGNDPTKYGGYSSKIASGENGWVHLNGASNTNNNVRASYAYRYVLNAHNPGQGLLIGTDPGTGNRLYNAKIEALMKLVPAAVWDVNGTDITFNPRYHPGGFNILYYDGSVAKLSATKWDTFPDNMDSTFGLTADSLNR